MKHNREGFRADFREAIRLLEEMMTDDEMPDDQKELCQSIVGHILEGWDDLELHFDEIEAEQRKQGGKFGFLPGGQVYLDDDELDPGEGV